MCRKFLKLVLLIMLSFILIACTKQTSDTRLTVSNIVENVYITKTSTRELKELFGTPEKVLTKSEKVNDIYFNISNGGVTDKLNASELYKMNSKIDSKKYNKQFDDTEDHPFDSYYQYQGNRLGLAYVRFYVSHEVIYDIEYGPVTNKAIAKKDKYLRQILD